MGTTVLRVVNYADQTLATANYVVTFGDYSALTQGTYHYYVRDWLPPPKKFKDQWRNSAIAQGRQLMDYYDDVSETTLLVTISALNMAQLGRARATLNGIAEGTRHAQKRKARGVGYSPFYLLFNLLASETNTSKMEILTFDWDYLPGFLENKNLVNGRVEIQIRMTVATYSTASILNLVTSASLTNGASNYFQVSKDTTAYTIANAALTSNVVTLTLNETPALLVGDWIVEDTNSLDPAFDGIFKLTAVNAGAKTIQYPVTHADIGSAAATGNVTSQYIRGSGAGAFRAKVAGGTAYTDKMYVAVRGHGTPSNFIAWYWAKDAQIAYGTVTNAALTSNVATLTIPNHLFQVGDSVTAASISLDAAFNGTYTVTAATYGASGTISYALVHANIGSAASTGTVTGRSAPRTGDTTLDGNGTNAGTRTTATSTAEVLTHRWINATNPSDQFGTHRVFLRCRSNTAGRYSVRARFALSDGTNIVYPPGDGYTLSTDALAAVGTDSGNALAWVDMGNIKFPAKDSGGVTVYANVLELYTTCSNVTGSPTFDVDGVFLMPTGEGELGSGICAPTYDLGTGATGVNAAWVDATPNMPPAYLADATPTVTFPTIALQEGGRIYLQHEAAYRVYVVLLDTLTSAGNPRHDYTQALTVTADYETRWGGEGRAE